MTDRTYVGTVGAVNCPPKNPNKIRLIHWNQAQTLCYHVFSTPLHFPTLHGYCGRFSKSNTAALSHLYSLWLHSCLRDYFSSSPPSYLLSLNVLFLSSTWNGLQMWNGGRDCLSSDTQETERARGRGRGRECWNDIKVCLDAIKSNLM